MFGLQLCVTLSYDIYYVVIYICQGPGKINILIYVMECKWNVLSDLIGALKMWRFSFVQTMRLHMKPLSGLTGKPHDEVFL